MFVKTFILGVLTDRELRTLTAVLYPLPLTIQDINDLENKLKNCSHRLKSAFTSSNNTSYPSRLKKSFTKKEEENPEYYDEHMPVVTKELFINCHEVWKMMNDSEDKEKYKHEIMGEEDLAFKMIRNNVSHVLHQLDWVRKHRRKFVCINDDLDHDREDSRVVRKILKDFYESYFPIPSQFELKPNQRNRFLYKKDMDEWNSHKSRKTSEFNQIIVLFIFLILCVLYFRKVMRFFRGCFRTFYIRGRRGWVDDI